MEKLKRYVIFIIGLFINSMGVSLITKADLGTSPISAIPYVLSLNFRFSLGQFTIAFSLLLILLQLLILGKNFKPEHALQIPVSIAFGYFIDLCMELLFFIQPQSYPQKVVYLLAGCVILARGMSIVINSNAGTGPNDLVAVILSDKIEKIEFRWIRVACDLFFVVLGFVLGGTVGAGTIAAVFLTGPLVQFWLPITKKWIHLK